MSIRYGFIGGGNMATAILGGLLVGKVCSPSEILVSDVSEERRETLEKEFSVATTTDNARVAAQASCLVLAIKPQVLGEVASTIRGSLPAPTPVVSILAGIRTERLREALGGHSNVVRTMPNLPATVGCGVAGIAEAEGIPEETYRVAEALLGTVGGTVRVPEALIDALTAVSGSGPGYVFRIAESMVSGAMAAGLPAEEADFLVRQTLLGAATLLASSEESAGTLCARVCSPGGTTLAGLDAMEKAGLSESLRKGILAARDRSLELAKGT
jgi:pyrroline-5-carboxylate reductase